MDFGLDGLQFLLRNANVAIVHENLLIATPRTRVIAAQRLEVLFLDFDACFLCDFSSSYSYEVSTLIDHSCRCLEQSGLDWNPILLDQQQFLIDEHEYGHGGSSQEDISRQFIAVFLSDGSHADKAYIVSEHFHAEDLDLEHIGSFLEGVESFHVVSELFAGLDLGQDGLVDVGKREYRDDACLQGEFEGLDHDINMGYHKEVMPYMRRIDDLGEFHIQIRIVVKKFQVIPFNIQYFQLFSPQTLSDDPLVPYQQQIEQYQQVKMLAKPKDPQYDKWIQALIIVTFDIDQGQKISHIIPGPVDPQTDKEISMLAFPDSNSFGEYQGIFKYLFKTKDGLYGFVCFKQKKDANNKRGYSQKSFVVLTRLPFLVFFQKLAEFLVFKLLALDEGQLHQELVKVKNQSQKWPQPQPLTSYILPVLDYQIAVDIPNYVYDLNGASLLKVQNFHSSRKQSKTSLEQIVTQQTLLQFGRFQEVKLTEHFDSCYEELWLIWETVMLNRPLLIMSDNPHRSSQAVLAAISLMNPLEYGGEFYPYVTVYDTHLNQLENAESDVVFGATNPLFLKLFASNRTTIVQLGAAKVPKHLKPLKELFVKSKLAEQKIVNQSALRKYFYKVNCGIISIVQEYAQLQTNDLKFFNEKDFLRFLRKREGENVLSQVFDDRRYSLKFWQEFTKTFNFSLLLRSKNMVREKC